MSTVKIADPLFKNITLIGAGTIGLSFAALHLNLNPVAHITIYDTRPDLEEHISSTLPSYLSTTINASDLSYPPGTLSASSETKGDYWRRITLAKSLAEAVANADVIQEQGPEDAAWKQQLWKDVAPLARKDTLFWSSTSGIPASVQGANLSHSRPSTSTLTLASTDAEAETEAETDGSSAKSRLIVVHPYNPPHIMPLLEIVPSPQTTQATTQATQGYWKRLGRKPILLQRETPGFAANRLAFALLREAISLVHAGVIGAVELDDLVTGSMGPRWAVQGPFRSYAAGGGKEGGIGAFWAKIGATVGDCWGASEEVKVAGQGGVGGGVGVGEWMDDVFGQVDKAYGGRIDVGETTRLTAKVIEVMSGGCERREEREYMTVEEQEQEDR